MSINTLHAIEILRKYFISTSYHSSFCINNTIDDVVESFILQHINASSSKYEIKVNINNINIKDFTEMFLIAINSKTCSCGKSGLVN